MTFSKQVQLGEEKFHVHAEDAIELFEVTRRIAEMNRMCGGKGQFQVRDAEKKSGKKKATIVTYREMVTYVPKLPFDEGEYKYTRIKMRISPETEPKYEQWPFFIFRTQKWHWHHPEKEIDYFLDDDGKWYEGTYDSETAIWTRS